MRRIIRKSSDGRYGARYSEDGKWLELWFLPGHVDSQLVGCLSDIDNIDVGADAADEELRVLMAEGI